MCWIINEGYTREKIAAELGGSAESYLPRSNGVIVCACLRRDHNPDAPRIILPGLGPEVCQLGEELCNQQGAIPVFIKEDVNRWQYVGDYEVDANNPPSVAPDIIREHEVRSGRFGREGISRVIYMVEA